jgi:predicted alpha/beta-hydrolase family hydrolase
MINAMIVGTNHYAIAIRFVLTTNYSLSTTQVKPVNTQSLLLQVSSSIGTVSAEYIIPENAVAIVTLAHGAGAGMHHPFMTALATSLAEERIATLRFNFPFIKNNKKRVDVPAVANQTIAAAITQARSSFPSLPLFAAGKSFGGRMSSQYLSLNPIENVKGIIFYGFPLHSAGKPSIDRAEHLHQVTVPMLFLQGNRDALAAWELIAEVCASLKPATLVKLEGADHSMKSVNTIKLLAKNTKEWIDKL